MQNIVRSRFRPWASAAVVSACAVAGCGGGGEESSPADAGGASGGAAATGGNATPTGGRGTGGALTGGQPGTSTGGAGGKGGTSTGGVGGTGGTSTGGTSTGGTSTGGTSTGGTSTGGASTGGDAGGRGMGGRGGIAGGSTGGSGAGGATNACVPTFEDPPANVSAWIDESWAAQLGNNVKTRKDWLLDSVMMGKGQINLCVRWGATTAPSAAVKSGMAGAVEKWLNDWFTNLAGYGCFPFDHITAKVTGWAVKPGKESWVSDLGSAVKVYTETDGEGEPKCPDACSFFENWSHTFPQCAGGEAFHTDYWLWLDDTISGGAAAVGGDWGLRMPVDNFVASMNKSNLVIEHEMGHGFGFQDYYDWTGSKPTGGSLMIVGSTNSQTPTTGDKGLLRRTWKEMKALRKW